MLSYLFEMNWFLIICGLLRLPSVKLFKNGREADVTEESRQSAKTLTKMVFAPSSFQIN